MNSRRCKKHLVEYNTFEYIQNYNINENDTSDNIDKSSSDKKMKIFQTRYVNMYFLPQVNKSNSNFVVCNLIDQQMVFS